MATSTIMSDKFTSEALVSGATLIRYGNMRILRLGGYQLNNGAVTIPANDRPSSAVAGYGVRANGGAYLCLGAVIVNTNGSLTIFAGGTYNTPSGWVNAGATDTIDVDVMWWL